MNCHSCRIAGALAGALGVMVATLLASPPPARAQAPQAQAPQSQAQQVHAQPTESEIADKLMPIKTRGFGFTTRGIGDPKPAEEQAFINSLRSRSVRSINLVERQKLDEIAQTKPKIDLEITFDYNSDVVSAEAQPVLRALGGALSRADLKGTVFTINGHTDGKGGDQYNQDLSERRAEAVKRELVKLFNLPDNTLIAVGYGKSKLKNKADPLAAENRRVQIVNTEVK
jgi:outer membrane protein OmpA-like peptidoglycan-associated protein